MPTMTEAGEYLTLDQAAQLAGVTERTIRNWMARKQNRLPYLANKAGVKRIRRTDLDAFLRLEPQGGEGGSRE